VAPLEQGQIVMVELLDPAHRNAKVRPAIVVTPTEEISVEAQLLAVAITGTLPKPLPASYVLLPYHAKRHPRTGLTKRCAAVCEWLVEFDQTKIERQIGRVPDKVLVEILAKVANLEADDN
jgi:mRNA-degrading endonuclease toxin of MazEF toxin-antitoxin module